jgi:acyl-CoA reductase-like NAD-dependent aldehyde dehydrogenase
MSTLNVSSRRMTELMIGGQWVAPSSTQTVDVVNPASGGPCRL